MTPLGDRIAALAAAGETATYGALARELGLRMGELTAALEAMMVEDAAAGRPLRAVLCRQRLSPDALPAPGFFAAAASLGIRIDDLYAYVAEARAQLRAKAAAPRDRA